MEVTQGRQQGGARQQASSTDTNTIFVRGFDKSQGEDDVRAALQEAFGECGEVVNVRLPSD